MNANMENEQRGETTAQESSKLLFRDHERGQMLNYLRITGLKVGVILNFKRAKLEWERIVLEKKR
jgi:hypothetical protein